MMSTDEDALICDFAETYHILNYRALPIDLAAVLACGLRDNARIKAKMAGVTYAPLEMVVPKIADDIALFRYSFSKDSEAGRNMPPLWVKEMYKERRKRESDMATFRSGEDFQKEWNRIVSRSLKNG